MYYHVYIEMEEGDSMSGYRHCITESAADRQRQFETALLDLMEHRNFSQISVQDICDRVGLSRKSFYRYFSSKEMCLTALVDHTILDFRRLHLPDLGLAEALTHYFLYWFDHRPLLDVLVRDNLADILIRRSIASADEEGDFYKGVSGGAGNMSQERAVFLIGGLVGVLLYWHQEGCRTPPEQLAASVRTFLLGAVRGDH